MFAGDARIISEPVSGTRIITTKFTTSNGKEIKKEEKVTKILDEGTEAHIAKGTLGYPMEKIGKLTKATQFTKMGMI